MMQINWFDRKFDFSHNANTLPLLRERLARTSLRLKEMIMHMDHSSLVIQPAGKWSVLEHIGHLADLEPLWQGRLDDILNGEIELRPADLTNTKTNEANHNSKTATDLIEHFDGLRTITLHALSGLQEGDATQSAIHPRMKTPMTIIDLFTFVAEHDDHHLTRMDMIIHLLTNQRQAE